MSETNTRHGDGTVRRTPTTAGRRLTRRSLLGMGAGGAAAVAGAAAASGTTQTPTAPTSASTAPAGQAATLGVRLRWWGNNSWQIEIPAADGGSRSVLIDPWLTRFPTGTYTSQGADPQTALSVDTALIDRHLASGLLRADHILVTHGHYDHLPDVPYLARRTGATVLGTETHVNLMLALDAPQEQMSVVVGGEYLDFGDYRIRVLRSLHSATGDRRARVAFPGTRPGRPPKRPRVIADLVEGGTLGYLVEAPGGAVLDLGGSNFVESELAGLRPDVVLLPTGGSRVYQYVPRLLQAVGHPPYVLPTHWDDFDLPLGEPAKDTGGLEPLRAAVAAASPNSRFVTLDHLQTFPR